ncbi:MAG: hypothetical protein AAFY71_03100 [Bacteroidota bacterium]
MRQRGFTFTYKSHYQKLLRTVGIGLVLLAALTLYGQAIHPMAICLGALGIFFLFLSTKVVADQGEQYIRYTYVILGVRVSKWYALPNHKDILVIKEATESPRMYKGESLFGVDKSSPFVYKIYIADSSHYDRRLIYQIAEEQKALKLAWDIANVIGAEVVQVNPGGKNIRVVLASS